MTKQIADRFRAMADRIEKNADEPFGGCVMIFPPGENAEPVELLWLDPKTDVAAFWGAIKGKCDFAMVEHGNLVRSGMAGFRR